MSRPSKPARLRLRPARPEKQQKAVWCIVDSGKEHSTGFGAEELGSAEAALQDYLSAKHTSAVGETALAKLMIADVIEYYIDKKEPSSDADDRAKRDFKELMLRAGRLLEWWGDKSLLEINEDTCDEYVAWRTAQKNRRATKAVGRNISSSTARRELEDLRAAIRRYHARYTLPAMPAVTLPEKGPRRDRALTRTDIAEMLLACLGWRKDALSGRMAKIPNDGPSGSPQGVRKQIRARRRHVPRLVLIGVYSGTRHDAMIRATWTKDPNLPWIDVDNGLFFRRGSEERQTSKRQPTARIPSQLLRHLRRWREQDRNKGIKYVVHVHGKPLADRVRTAWEGMCRDAGIGPSEVTVHVLRHTAATWLMEGATPISEVAEYLGMSEEVLRAHYLHLRPDFQASVGRGFENQKQRSQAAKSNSRR